VNVGGANSTSISLNMHTFGEREQRVRTIQLMSGIYNQHTFNIEYKHNSSGERLRAQIPMYKQAVNSILQMLPALKQRSIVLI
jgi:hypothetical protein